MAWARALRVNAVFVSREQVMKIPAHLQSVRTMAKENLLIDSRATANVIDHRTLQRIGFLPFFLEQ